MYMLLFINIKSFTKGYEVMKGIKIYKFQGDWDKLQIKTFSCRGSWVKYLNKIKKSSKNGQKQKTLTYAPA